MGRAALHLPPNSQVRRSDAGVRRVSLAAEHGLQSLDVNVLLLTTSRLSTGAQLKAGNEQRSKACPCTPEQMRGEEAWPIKGFLVPLSLTAQPSQAESCTARMFTRLGKQRDSRFLRCRSAPPSAPPVDCW